MEELKSLFGEGSLTYDEFESKINENGNIKLANLKSGAYVDKAKFEKANSNYSELEAKYNTLFESTKNYETERQELETYRQEKVTRDELDKITNAKVDSKYAKFVLSEIKSTIKEGEKFDDVLANYVKANPQYLAVRQGVFKFGTSTPNMENNGSGANLTVNQTMNDLIRNRGDK